MDNGEGQQHDSDFLDLDQLLQLDTLGSEMDGLSVEPNYTNMMTDINGANANTAAPDQNNNNNEISQRRVPKRHRREQIEQLEAAFKKCPYPDEIILLDLSQELGLRQMQVKCWFQNRRATQKNKMMQRQSGRELLREETEILQDEKRKIKAVLYNKDKRCHKCRGAVTYNRDTQEKRRLLAENTKLKQELVQASAFLEKVSGRRARGAPIPMPAFSPYGHASNLNNSHSAGAATSGVNNGSPTMLLGHVSRASQEFMSLVRTMGEPMWLPSTEGHEVLNSEIYNAVFRPNPTPTGFVMDGTRKTAMVMVKAANLITILMDPVHWAKMFPGIVAGVTSSHIVNPKASPHELIQLMNAKLRVLVPRVPLAKVKFARQCLQVEPNIWAVVDVSIDGALEQDGGRMVDMSDSNGGFPTTYTAYRMLPSGCLIEDMKNGYCKITWMVHAEYNQSKMPTSYHPLHQSGHALGACRWLNSLQRQCEYFAFLHSGPVPPNPAAAMLPEARKRALESAQRMTMSFFTAMCDSAGQPWSAVSEWSGGDGGAGAERLDLAVRFVTSLAAGNGDLLLQQLAGTAQRLVLSAMTTVWLPGIPAQSVFEYLSDGNRRGEWDALISNGEPMQEEARITTGQFHGNYVSVFRSIASNGTNNNNKLILQEAYSDTSCMMVVYAPVDEQSMKDVMNGGGHASFSAPPCGFAVLPDGLHQQTSTMSYSGTIVSAMYQTLPSGAPPQNLTTIDTVNHISNLLGHAIKMIRCAVKARIVVPA